MRSDMEIRHKLLMAVTALLYFGPLLAGMGGFGWSVVPVFLMIFVLWLVVMRPQDWPQSRADWRSGDIWVAMAARIAVQVLLVVVLFGVGRGIGGMLGVLPAIPALLPLAISGLAIPFARMIWDPAQAGHADNQRIQAEVAVAITRPLAELPPATPDAELRAHLAALSEQLAPADLTRALQEHAARSWAARRSLELLAQRGA